MSDNEEADRTDPRTRTITDAKTLSAMANPDRSRILDAMAVDGPATASTLATTLGLAVGSTSHHLKVLSAAGLVQEAPELARDRRERWWRLVSASTRWSRVEFAQDAGAVTAALAAESLALQQQFDRAQTWLTTEPDDQDFLDAAFATQTWLRLTPDELRELSVELVELLRRWRVRPEPAADDTRQPILVFARGFPAQP